MTLHAFVKAMDAVNDQCLLHLYMQQLFATMTKVLDFCKRLQQFTFALMHLIVQ